MVKVTIKDVAKEAGVSISTVSNALNDVDVLTPDTKKRVLEVAQKLNYIPDLRGKNLKAKNTKMIGFFTTNVSGAYFHNLVESMAKETERNGYGLSVFVSKDKQVILNNIFGGSIDGAIIMSKSTVGDKEVELIDKRGLTTIFLDREAQSKKTGSVLFTPYESSFEATSYLINLGHRNIAFIAGNEDTYNSVERKHGYIDALKQNGITPNHDYVIQGFYEREAGYNAVKTFIKKYPGEVPDAFLAANDLSAIGAIESLESEGLRVPTDVSVMGFDDIEIAKYHKPPLTTVRNPISRQGVLAVQQMVAMINDEAEGEIQKLPGKIISRESTIPRTESLREK